MKRFLCEPCDHRWYEHRHPDPKMRYLGLAMMLVGTVVIALALAELGLHL